MNGLTAFSHKAFICIRGLTQLVIDVSGMKLASKLRPQLTEQVQHRHGIRPAGDSEEDFLSRLNEAVTFDVMVDFLF